MKIKNEDIKKYLEYLLENGEDNFAKEFGLNDLNESTIFKIMLERSLITADHISEPYVNCSRDYAEITVTPNGERFIKNN